MIERRLKNEGRETLPGGGSGGARSGGVRRLRTASRNQRLTPAPVYGLCDQTVAAYCAREVHHEPSGIFSWQLQKSPFRPLTRIRGT